jgi:hypothetical protein
MFGKIDVNSQKNTSKEIRKETSTKDEILFLNEIQHLTGKTAYEFLTSNKHRLTPNLASQLLTPTSLKSLFEHYPGYLPNFINLFFTANLLTPDHADELLNVEFLVKVYQKNPTYLPNFIDLFFKANLLTPDHANKLLKPEFLVKVYQGDPGYLPNFIDLFFKANLLTPEHADELLKVEFLEKVYHKNPTYLPNFIDLFFKANLLTPDHADELLNVEFLVKVYQGDPGYLPNFIDLFFTANLLTPEHADELLKVEFLEKVYQKNPTIHHHFIKRFIRANLLTPEHVNKLLKAEFLVKMYQKNPIIHHSFIDFFIRANLLSPENVNELFKAEILVKVYQRYPSFLPNFIKRFIRANLLTPEHANKLLKVEFLEKVYQKNLTHLHYFTDLNLHRLVEDKEVLNEYCRYLVQYSYEYPEKAGSVFHYIVEIQSMLSNEYDAVDSNEPSSNSPQSILSSPPSPSPYISQQNIIQMQSFAKALDVQTSFNTGSMIASSIGFLGEDVKLEFVSQEEINTSEGKDLSYSPHPDFALARIGNNNVFAIKNFESIEFQEIVKRIKMPDGTSKIFNTLKVRPIAVDSNFYHVYYQTEDNMVVRICLDMGRTHSLLNEGFEAFSDISQYFSEIFEDKKVKEQGIGERTSVSEFVDYLLVRYSGLQEYVGVQKKGNTKQISWESLLSSLEESKDTVFQEFPEAYKALFWHCTNEIALEATSHVKNTVSRTSEAVIRLLGSKDHDHYFKICQSLLMRDSQVLAGDTVNNSHTFVFIDKMNNIKQNKPAETVTTPFLRCYLPTELQQEEEFQDYYYDVDEETIKTPKKLIIQGKNLKEMNPQLAFKINLIYQTGKQISIDHKKLTKEEFQEYKLNPGDHVRIVG